MTDRVQRAQTAVETAEERVQRALDALDAADDNIADEELEALNGEFDEAEAERTAAKAGLAREERIAAARAALPAPVAGNVTVVREALTYEPGNPERGWFSDLYKATKNGDGQARERLIRNNTEVEVERTERMAREKRALNSTDGTGGEFVIPIWMGDYIAAPVAGRVFADRLPQLPLPQYGGTVNWPRLDSNTSVAVHSDGGAVSSTDASTDALSIPIKLLAGQNDLSRESLERSHPGLDQALLDSLAKNYNKAVDNYCLNDATVGVLNASGFNAIDYADTTPTAPELYPFLFKGLSKVASSIFEDADAIFMHSRRWYWLLSQLDSQNRPWILPNSQGPTNAMGNGDATAAQGFAGTVCGVPVYLDQVIPTNLTADSGTGEDAIAISRLDNMFLMEDGIRRFTFQEVLSGNGQIRLQVVGYVGFGTYHLAGNSVITGSGMAAPTGF